MKPSKPGNPDEALRRLLAEEAAGARRELGPPPTDEQLRALWEGRLSEEEAERLRELLSADPEWVEAFFEMGRDGEDPEALAELARSAGVDAEEGWRQLETRLASEQLPEPLPEAIPRRPGAPWSKILLPLAAGLVLVLGAWWLLSRGLPESEYFVATLEPSTVRGTVLTVPSSAAGLELRAQTSDLEHGGDFGVQLADAQGRIVVTRQVRLASGSAWVQLRVPRQELLEEAVYFFRVKEVGGGGVLLETRFTVRFVET